MNWRAVVLSIFLILINLQPVAAQGEEEIELHLSRDWGYSSGTGKIQGLFTLKAASQAELERVIFYIDDQVIGEVQAAPFRYQFDTDQYPLGVHTIWAKGITTDGSELVSKEYRQEFVSADVGWQTAARIAVPLVGIIVGVILLSFVLPAVLGRGKRTELAPGTPRIYSPLGGAVCPNCKRPFAIHLYGFNLLVGKYDRCPYCGKWSLVRRASMDALRAAEQAELSILEMGSVLEGNGEDKLRKDLDDSRFSDL